MKKLVLMLLMFAPLATFAQQKFGHINAQEVMSQMPEFIKARGEMEAKAKQYENDLKAMQDELQRKSQEYDKNKSTMNATKQQETETELNNLYQKYQQALQDNQQSLAKEQQDKMQPVVTKVRNAINNVGKTGGYTYIFEDGVAIYTGANVDDVTAKVQAEIAKMK